MALARDVFRVLNQPGMEPHGSGTFTRTAAHRILRRGFLRDAVVLDILSALLDLLRRHNHLDFRAEVWLVVVVQLYVVCDADAAPFANLCRARVSCVSACWCVCVRGCVC